MLAQRIPIPDLVIYLEAKLETLKRRIAKKKVPFEDRISNEYLEAVVDVYEHFFFHYKSSDLLVIDSSEVDFVDRSEHLQELLQRLSQPVKGTQYILPLGSAPAD
jgi:deoxyadenosine/deoxycytidine kinase